MEKRCIEFVRGDTFLISRYFKDKEDNILTLNPKEDELTFTVRDNIYSPVIIQKKLSDMEISQDGKYTIVLNPSDTESLDSKTYKYDLEIRIGKNEKNPYVITPESGTITLQEFDFSRPEEK